MKHPKTNRWRLAFIATSLFALSGCAHSYYYLPEIEGEGAIHGKSGAIVYRIPPTASQPELKVGIHSLGIRSVRGQPMIGVAVAVVRPKGAPAPVHGSREFLDPSEQILKLAGGQELKPAYVHTKARLQSVIELTGRPREIIELLYALPKPLDGPAVVERYSFQWRIHYGLGKSERQAIRFDRYDSRPQQAAELYPEDPDYPYDVSPVDMPGWDVVRDPFWWSPLDPVWPGW